MPVPKLEDKINVNSVEYRTSVTRTEYLLSELTRSALRDVAELIKHNMGQGIDKLKITAKEAAMLKDAIQHKIRKKETNLQIGITNNSWYDVDQELGTSNQHPKDLLRNTVYNSIGEIKKIEEHYLSALEDENRALELIDDREELE